MLGSCEFPVAMTTQFRHCQHHVKDILTYVAPRVDFCLVYPVIFHSTRTEPSAYCIGISRRMVHLTHQIRTAARLCVLMAPEKRQQHSGVPPQTARPCPGGAASRVGGRTSLPRARQHAASRARNQCFLHTLPIERPRWPDLRSNPLSDGAPTVTNHDLDRRLE